MAKQSGLGDNFYVQGYDLSGDTGSLGGISGSLALLEKTGINKYAMERIGGLRDGYIEWISHFNPATGQAHEALSALPRTDVMATYCRGVTLGSPAACTIGKQLNYDGTRADDGDLTFAIRVDSNQYGVEWGKQLTAGLRTDTAATNGTGVDFGTGSTAFGLQAYLQVTGFTGTDATVKLQQSSDNGAGDAWADVTGGGFTQITGDPTVQRIQTARGQTVERYLRVVTTTAGGFSSLQFSVVVVRNVTSVVF